MEQKSDDTQRLIAAVGYDASRAAIVRRIPLWFLGCLLFSIGIKCFIDSRLGTDPLHAMVIGIVDELAIPYVKIGVIELCVVVVSLVVWCTWNKRVPIDVIASVFFTMVVVGFLVDFWNYLRLERITTLVSSPVALCVIGLVADAEASALIIIAGFGIRNMDLLAITMVQRMGWPFIVSKMLLESGFVAIGWLTGGPVGAATLLFVLIVGSLIQPLMELHCRLLGLTNYGMATGH